MLTVPSRRRFLLRLLLVVLIGLAARGSAGADIKFDWQPRRTWVFAVGLLNWQHPNIWPAFPAAEKNRRDEQLVDYFRKAGVPENQIIYLQDAQATKRRIEHELGAVLDRTARGDLLVFYFCGHGYRDRKTGLTWFANYDAGAKDSTAWNVRGIFETIDDRFQGNRVLMLADCCHSGALFDEALARRDSRIAYAALTSSYSHNSSTGQWTFSDSVLRGLSGHASVDFDGDGVIALRELARHTELEMAFIEGQKSMFVADSRFPADAKLIAASGVRKPHEGEHVEGWWQGKWYKARVIDAADERRKVHWIGYGTDWDGWLPPTSVRPYQPASFATDAEVEVRWSGDKTWYPATVLKSWYGLHLVHYEGYSSTWDEWIGPASIRQATKKK